MSEHKKLVRACPDCGNDMVLRESGHGPFYGCVKWPACNATHGAYPDGTPLGVPADKETRQARMDAHDAFDKLGKGTTKAERKSARGKAYVWLREQLGLTRKECHIGRFDKKTCLRVMELCEKRRDHYEDQTGQPR